MMLRTFLYAFYMLAFTQLRILTTLGDDISGRNVPSPTAEVEHTFNIWVISFNISVKILSFNLFDLFCSYQPSHSRHRQKPKEKVTLIMSPNW